MSQFIFFYWLLLWICPRNCHELILICINKKLKYSNEINGKKLWLISETVRFFCKYHSSKKVQANIVSINAKNLLISDWNWVKIVADISISNFTIVNGFSYSRLLGLVEQYRALWLSRYQPQGLQGSLLVLSSLLRKFIPEESQWLRGWYEVVHLWRHILTRPH